MRVALGVLLVAAGTAIGSASHFLPAIDGVSQLATITRILTSPPSSLTTAASAEAKRPAELTTALARGYVEPGQPRVFSPDQPLFVAPTETQRPSGRAAAPVRTAQAVTSEMRVASDSAVRTLPPIEPRAVDAVQPRLQPERPSVQSGNRAQPVKPKDEDGKSALVRDLQRELKRVGCYDGEISGSWSAATRRAMSTFIERVNATLPVEQPDFILLTLVQGSQPSACAAKCASDQAIGDGGRCLSKSIQAQSVQGMRKSVGPSAPATTQAAAAVASPQQPSVTAAIVPPTPVPAKHPAKIAKATAPFPAAAAPISAPTAAPAARDQQQVATSGWTTSVQRAAPADLQAAAPQRAAPPATAQALAQAQATAATVATTTAVAAARPAVPLPGRMSVGAPASDAAIAPAVVEPPVAAEIRRKEVRDADVKAAAAKARARRLAEADDERSNPRARGQAREYRAPSPRNSGSTSFKRPGAVRDFFFSPTRSF